MMNMSDQAKKLTEQIKEFSKVVDVRYTSLNHLLIFSQICKMQPTTLHNLQQVLGLHKSTTCRIVNSLSDNRRGKEAPTEIIEIRMMLEDRRHREIRLTLKGRALMNKMFGDEDE
jgi:DNA-binding MarR family transcriptional regulator